MPAYTQPSSMGLTPPTPGFGRPQDAGYSRPAPISQAQVPVAPTAPALNMPAYTQPSSMGFAPAGPTSPEAPRQGLLSGFVQNANAQARGLGFDIAPDALSAAADRNEELRNLVNDTQAGAMRSSVDTQRELAAREARKFDYGMTGLRAPAASQRVLDAARQRGASAQQLSNIQTEADRIQQRLLSAGRGGGQGFNEGGQVRGYQDGGMPQPARLDVSGETPSFEVDPAKLRSGEPGAFTFNGQIATPGDGSSFERAAQNRQALGSFFSDVGSGLGSLMNPATYQQAFVADRERRQANRQATAAAAAERRAANTNLASSFGQAARGLAATPGNVASDAATMFHRMGGGAEKDAYDAGYQAGYQKGLSEGTSTGKAEVRTRMAGATRSMDEATAGAARGPVAPMSQYTLRQGTASRVGQVHHFRLIPVEPWRLRQQVCHEVLLQHKLPLLVIQFLHSQV